MRLTLTCFHAFMIWLSNPVYVIGAERCTWKFADFQKSLQERGVARPFTGKEDVSQLVILFHHIRVLLFYESEIVVVFALKKRLDLQLFFTSSMRKGV